ncbi:uncharacterized protein [Rutidosis leptorrhynchoides]|uniref:uncharacterized protein n=1 Tax=Rutidosis leptorrhynchoides TaxID=125765 RepID=UPI003A99A030
MAWVKWLVTLASYEKGGLQIGSLKAFNLALLQKWRWRCNVNSDSLWAKLLLSIFGQNFGFAEVDQLHKENILQFSYIKRKVGDGSSIRFWTDCWSGDIPLCISFNRLYHLDQNKACLLTERRVNNAYNWNWQRKNIGARNEAAVHSLIEQIGPLQLGDDRNVWRCSIMQDSTFTVKEIRSYIDDKILPSSSPCTKWNKTLPKKSGSVDKFSFAASMFMGGLGALVRKLAWNNYQQESAASHRLYNLLDDLAI